MDNLASGLNRTYSYDIYPIHGLQGNHILATLAICTTNVDLYHYLVLSFPCIICPAVCWWIELFLDKAVWIFWWCYFSVCNEWTDSRLQNNDWPGSCGGSGNERHLCGHPSNTGTITVNLNIVWFNFDSLTLYPSLIICQNWLCIKMTYGCLLLLRVLNNCSYCE